ncbi:hypothetical protein D3C86_1102850 [compost metagenome]
MKKLRGKRSIGHEVRPGSVRIEGEESGQAGAGDHPVELAVAGQVAEGLANRFAAVGHRNAGQERPVAITHIVAATVGAQWFAVVPGLVTAHQHAGHAFAIQVHQVIALAVIEAGHLRKLAVTLALRVELKRVVEKLHGWATFHLPLIVIRLDVCGGQMVVAQRTLAVFEQQALDQHRFVAQFFSELMKHQDLTAQAPGTQFKPVGVIPEGILARCAPLAALYARQVVNRHLRQVGATFAVIEQQVEMPGHVFPAIGFPCIQVGVGLGISVQDPTQVTLAAVVAELWSGRRFDFRLVQVHHMFTAQVQAFIDQPYTNVGFVGRIGPA